MERDDAYYASIEKSIAEIDLKTLTKDKKYYPSPQNWEDEILYFLLADRFSDGKERGGFKNNNGEENMEDETTTTPLFFMHDAQNTNWESWFENGKKWCGGNLTGLKNKLGYLKRLGITAIWLSPVFKQTHKSNNYHGYGIQNFLDVDPHFGNKEDLKELVAEAHRLNLRVILDVILNHAGNVFAYKEGNGSFFNAAQHWPVKGYKKDEDDEGSLPFEELDLSHYANAWPHGSVWPKEFQPTDNWTRKGKINDWNQYPEYVDGDFEVLKDIRLGSINPNIPLWDVLQRIQYFEKDAALHLLCEVYKYWIAYADIDGFRLDTVKHMEPGAVRYFVNVIHEFSQSIGKENFYIIGEITGGRNNAVNMVDTTGLDAALGIDDIQDKLEFLAKGKRIPGNPDNDRQEGYFDLFTNSLADGKNSHRWYGKRIVTMFDDHDQVGTARKFRYCGNGTDNIKTIHLAIALNLTTLGIPCLYYGTEQAFNGEDKREGEDTSYSDVFLRECMFGGPFGSYGSTGKHFFNEDHYLYHFISALCSLRKRSLPLRRGRQYLRAVSQTGNETQFYYPTLINDELKWVVAWSRIFVETEMVMAINTNTEQELVVWITVDSCINKAGLQMTCLFSTDIVQTGQQVFIESKNGLSIQVTVPAAGFVIYANDTV